MRRTASAWFTALSASAVPSPRTGTSPFSTSRIPSPPSFSSIWNDRRPAVNGELGLARIIREPPAAIADMAVFPGVLGSRLSRACRGEPCDLLTSTRPQQSTNTLSPDPKTILLSPLGGGEDQGEGVKCGVHPPTLTLSP